MKSSIGCLSQVEEDDFINDVRDEVHVNSMPFHIPQHETKDKKKKNKLYGYLRGRRWRESLITFGSQKNDLNKLRIIPGSGV